MGDQAVLSLRKLDTPSGERIIKHLGVCVCGVGVSDVRSRRGRYPHQEGLDQITCALEMKSQWLPLDQHRRGHEQHVSQREEKGRGWSQSACRADR